MRYSRKPITNKADFDAACDASALTAYKAVTPGASGAAEAVTVTGPDARDPANLCKFAPASDNGITSYYFAVSAVDAAGNVGGLSNVVSTDQLRLKFMKIATTGAFNDQNYRARVFALGDLNGDGLGEVGLGGGASTQFCVLYGRPGTADIDLATEPASGLQCFANPGGLAGVVGKPADVNGDGVTDLVLGAKIGSGITREVWVFLGNKGAQLSPAPAVVIKGPSASAAVQGPYRLNTIGNFNGDVSASNIPVADIAVMSLRDANNASAEVVYIIPGNTAWSNAAPLTIDVTKQIERANNNVARIWAVDEPNASSLFGSWLQGGNVLVENGGVGQQFDELIAAQQSGPQQLVIIKGRALSGATDINLTVAGINGTQPEDQKTVRISPSTTGQQAFGQQLDLVEFDNKVGMDMVVQHQTNLLTDNPGFYLIPGGASLAPFLGAGANLRLVLDVVSAVSGVTSLYFTKAGTVQYVFMRGPRNIGNFFDDPAATPHDTILYCRQNIAGITGGGQQLIFRMAAPHTELNGGVGYFYEDVVLTDVFVPTNKLFGTGSVPSVNVGYGGLGDFNGDGLVDVVVGSSDTSGTPGSTMIVY